jgi:hypothetical protein
MLVDCVVDNKDCVCYFAGPNLYGLFGRQSSPTAGCSYSAANKNKAADWEESTLYDYTCSILRGYFLRSEINIGGFVLA